MRSTKRRRLAHRQRSLILIGLVCAAMMIALASGALGHSQRAIAEEVTASSAASAASDASGANASTDSDSDSDSAEADAPRPVRIVYHFVDRAELDAARDFADYDTTDTVVYYERPATSDSSVEVIANRHPETLLVATDALHFAVIEDYASTTATGHGQIDRTADAAYDAARGVVTLPAAYADRDLTIVFYVDRAAADQSFATEVTVSAPAGAETLSCDRAPLDPMVSVRLFNDPEIARQVSGLHVFQGGVETTTFTYANGSLCLLASSLGGPIDIRIDAEPESPTAAPDAVAINTSSDVMLLSAEAPVVGDRFAIRAGGADILNSESGNNSAAVCGWPEKSGAYGFPVHFKEGYVDNPEIVNADINHIAPGGTVHTSNGGSYSYDWARGLHFAWGDCMGDVSDNGAGLPVVESGWAQVTAVDYASGTVSYRYQLNVKSDVDGHNQQTIGGVFQIHEDMGGYLRIVKRSARGEMSDGSDLYTLSGAVYGVYRDAGCTDEVTSITTAPQSYGVGGESGLLPLGTYWIREKARPTGFALDRNVYTATVAANQTTTVSSASGPWIDELPQHHPIDLLLKKRDDAAAMHDAGGPQGDATLAFAQFTVQYFDGYYGSADAAAASGPPLRTWQFQTDGDGRIRFDDSTFALDGATYPYKVGGDDFYRAPNGQPTAPLGTLVIRETAAPTGYHRNGDAVALTITSTNDEEITGQYATPAIDEAVIRGGVAIGKFDAETRTQVPQGDAKLAGTRVEITNRSAHAVVVGGERYEPGAVVATLATDDAGVAESAPDLLPYGSYEVREVAPPEGYLLTDGQPRQFSIREDGEIVTFEEDRQLYDDVIRGDVSVVKHDGETREAAPQGDGRLDQTRFEITTLSPQAVIVGGRSFRTGEVVATIVTNASGVAATVGGTLPYGAYEIHEVEAPMGYLLTDGAPRRFSIREDGVTVAIDPETAFYDDVIRGGVAIGKFDAETRTQVPQGDAKLAGTQIEITNRSAHAVVVGGERYEPGAVVATLATDDAGVAESAPDLLPYGSYEVREVAPPEGYLLTDGEARQFSIREDGVIVSFEDSQQLYDDVIRGGTSVQKLDRESGLATPLGDATLAGTVFEITNVSARAVLVDGVSFKPGEVVATLTTDEAGAAATAADALPYGAYEIREVEANEGYLLTDGEARRFSIREDGVTVTAARGDGGDGGQWRNQVKRGDLEFQKVGDGSMHRLAGVAFALTSATTGERHVIVTDENGYANTAAAWNPHTQRTNANDGRGDAEAPSDPATSFIDDEAGVWFGLAADGSTVEADDGLGALPYDAYTLEELPSEANAAYDLITVPNLRIKRDSVTVDLGTIDDPLGTVPAIETTASDAVDGDKIVSAQIHARIDDVVDYRGLTPGTTYHLEGTLMDKATGEPLVDADGTPITAAVDFTPDAPEGAQTVTFSFDATRLPQDADLVVFETLTCDGEPVCDHADLDDEGQTVTVVKPALTSLASDGADGDKTVTADSASTIADDVTLTNLVVGEDYELRSVLIDPTLVDGLPAAALFNGATPESNADLGNLDRARSFLLAYWDSIGIPYTDDYRNAETDMWFDLPTETIDEEDLDTAIAQCDDLFDTMAGERQPFTADAETMTLRSNYPALNTTALDGRTLRCFQMLAHGDEIVATEVAADYADEEVTVAAPTIGTEARDQADGDRYLAPSASATIVDRVAYQGLVPGVAYELSGVLMDKRTETPVTVGEGVVSATTTFTPATPDGEVELAFPFDAAALMDSSTTPSPTAEDATLTLTAGDGERVTDAADAESATAQAATGPDGALDLVVFESLLRDGFTVAVHHDIDDASQTVTLMAEPLAQLTPVKTDTPAPSAFAKTIDLLKGLWWVIPAGIVAAIAAIVVGRRAAGRAREIRRQGASQRALLKKIERDWSADPAHRMPSPPAQPASPTPHRRRAHHPPTRRRGRW